MPKKIDRSCNLGIRSKISTFIYTTDIDEVLGSGVTVVIVPSVIRALTVWDTITLGDYVWEVQVQVVQLEI